MGLDPQTQEPLKGFFNTSDRIYGKTPAQLSETEFIRLVAILIAPQKYHLIAEDKDLDERTRRISNLINGVCKPLGLNDVWLEGCGIERF